MKIRLQKYMAHAGVASRRKCETLISSGRVKVNGKIIKQLGIKIDPENDYVEIDDKKIANVPKNIYIMLNKTQKTVSTVADPRGRKTVIDHIRGIDRRVYPVGRLDYDTEGLLILTNDGNLTYKLTHPKYEIPKTYLAYIKDCPDEESLNALRRGVMLNDGLTTPAKVKITKKTNQGYWLSITIHEGKKRQVRRMFEAIGYPVIFLKREKIGELTLKGLKPGKWRYLTYDEINYLKYL